MTLPRFLSRVHDAAGPLLGGMASTELGDRLRGTSVVLAMPEDVAALGGQTVGYLFATNLLARLYPRLGFDAPSGLADEAVALARSINPDCVVGPPNGRTLTVDWGSAEPAGDCVTVAVEGWNVRLDGSAPTAVAAEPPAAMAAAALAVGELFVHSLVWSSSVVVLSLSPMS